MEYGMYSKAIMGHSKEKGQLVGPIDSWKGHKGGGLVGVHPKK